MKEVRSFLCYTHTHTHTHTHTQQTLSPDPQDLKCKCTLYCIYAIITISTRIKQQKPNAVKIEEYLEFFIDSRSTISNDLHTSQGLQSS